MSWISDCDCWNGFVRAYCGLCIEKLCGKEELDKVRMSVE